jgi:hypothetical protein
MSDISKSVECRDCGKTFNNLDQPLSKDNPCPNCGSFEGIVKVGINATLEPHGDLDRIHITRMSAELWTILGVILGVVIPLIFYAVFSILTISFWYKLLIWLGIILIPFFFAYRYRVIWYKIIMLLRSLADKTYGKQKYDK